MFYGAEPIPVELVEQRKAPMVADTLPRLAILTAPVSQFPKLRFDFGRNFPGAKTAQRLHLGFLQLLPGHSHVIGGFTPNVRAEAGRANAGDNRQRRNPAL